MSKYLLLERMPSTEECTEGFLSFGRDVLLTMERPWIAADTPGGLERQSCVPDGSYRLVTHKRPNGDETFALVNEDLGVYYLPGDVPTSGGRCLILIHIGNWVDDVIGCIAPGLAKGDSPTGRMVKHSTAAMQRLLFYIGNDADAKIDIKWILQPEGEQV